MVVWQGITEGGTAVPVQITEEGKVVAIGEAGPIGPIGPEGPPGPSGVTWPPNPIEGAFLVWLNGEPTWYTEQPIPTPPGIAGPIIDVSDNSLLTFADDLDQNVFFKGIQVYAVNADGSNWNGNGQYDTSQMWSLTSSGTPKTGTLQTVFDGDLDNVLTASEGTGPVTLFNTLITGVTTIGFYTNKQGAVETKYTMTYSDGTTQDYVTTDTGTNWYTVNTNKSDLSKVVLTVTSAAGQPDTKQNGLYAIRINNKTLLDPLAGPYPTGQISTVVNNSVLLSRAQATWTKGLYMKTDESAQAAWLFAKNKKGKILG